MTGDFTVRHFGDARDLNLRESFHRSMDRDLDWGQLVLPAWGQRALPATSIFLNETYDRFGGRILHAFGFHELENVYEVVAAPGKRRETDRKRVEELKNFIRTTNRPFFAHTHLLSTHGPIFHSEQRVFSTSRSAGERWLRESQDDAILQMDRYLEEIWMLLVEEGLTEETLLIINSDHGYNWGSLAPIPLIIRFPGRAHVGVRTENSQRIDIAPTILDFLGIPRPEWMEGRSLLSDGIDPVAPIVIVNRAKSRPVAGWRRLLANPKPPFYTLGEIYVNYCDVQYRMWLPSGQMRRRSIQLHTARCPQDAIPSMKRARQFLIDHLAAAGYDVSRLKEEP
jgi:hypothetical protein